MNKKEELVNIYYLTDEEIEKLIKEVKKEMKEASLSAIFQILKKKKNGRKIIAAISKKLPPMGNAKMMCLRTFYAKKIFLDNIKNFDFSKKEDIEKASDLFGKLIRWEYSEDYKADQYI